MSRLHYLYEQQGTGRERFVYYCSTCNCVLKVRQNLDLKDETIKSLQGRCLGCGCLLENSFGCVFAPVPDEWSDLRLKAPQSTTKPLVPVFMQASSYPHFSLGFPPLDSLLRPFRFTTLISGPQASVVAELAAFRAQLPLEMGGLDSSVVFVDGGNRSDPYLFSSFARQYGFRPATTMKRIANCRVFTMYQLTDLISGHLARAARDYAAGLVVISDLLGTFNEPELDEREARRLLSSVGEAIAQIKNDALVVVTLSSPNKYDDIVLSWADTAVNMTQTGGRVNAQLLKHPSKPPTTSSFRMAQLLMPAKATR